MKPDNTRVKLFFDHVEYPIDEQINDFIKTSRYEYVDTKFVYTENTQATQANLAAMLVYKAEMKV